MKNPTGIHTAMVLAAGIGSRLRPLTDDTPKPLVNVGGKPVVFRVIEAIKKAGIQRIVINTHYLGAMLEEAIRAQNFGIPIFFSREETLLETGGGIKKALPLLGENPFLVVNSDAVWNEDTHPMLYPLMEGFNAKKHDALMSVVPLESTRAFRMEKGDYIYNTRTRKLTKPQNRDLSNVVYCGVHVTHPAFIRFEKEEKFSLAGPWAEAASVGRLHGKLYKGPWVDMGSHIGLEVARQRMAPQPESLPTLS
jgi:MurNAc alpha-1-phosphate uridylyltransferase